MIKYLETKLVRSLILSTLTSMHIVARNYMFVPVQDFSDNSDLNYNIDLDTQLYRKYNLNDKEIAYINENIK